MISPLFHANRREALCRLVDGPILLMGNGHRMRNLPMNHLPFRQDSSFLYFTGCQIPSSAALIEEGEVTLFAPPPTDDDPLWHGPVPSLQESAEKLGITRVKPIAQLSSYCKGLSPKTIAVPDRQQNRLAEEITNLELDYGRANGNDQLIDAIIQLRRVLLPDEIKQMRTAAKVTDLAHRAAMAETHIGGHERYVAAAFDATIARHGLTNAYSSIVTVNGHILHNHKYINPLKDGQLLLLDGGAESTAGYASDVTRTWPVSGTFTPRQRAAYEAVLKVQKRCIEMVTQGVRYRDIHMAAARGIAQFLVAEKLLNISADDAVEVGAQALFFPHGIGHLIGLDVHDLENFGDRPAYAQGRTRSSQFGTGYLRLDLDLVAGMAVTIEPGFYVAPAILNNPKLKEHLGSFVNWSTVEKWNGFGGIRIEDDVLCTTEGPEIISGHIPKETNEIESLVGRSDGSN